ncbi:HFR052Wp [Eremothecium sinecaudum]|uniref:RNA polymerase II subunit B1 CTD phosphatase RPAP2 homolog n=1 Tax=Eremothecium sinecaudum TaxID=45286 RepID=A0A0X8HUS4_9SACH|nr:HFR052Wp [Eremothecium sinecaudum]AMD21907.1 HFR052Wp [Eremothecium sinecaudum]
MATIEDIKRKVLHPYRTHRQLSLKEADFLSVELLELLSQTECHDSSTLKYVGRFLTKATYADLIDERNLIKKCGYPLCNLSQGRVRDLYENGTVSNFLKQNNPYKYLTSFCSKFHFRCSQFYQVQLSDEALFARIGVHLDDHEVTNTIVLLEEAMARERDLKSVMRDMEGLSIDGDKPDAKEELQKDLSDWLSEVKIVENERTSMMGDFVKE